jgi:hypothetical protein
MQNLRTCDRLLTSFWAEIGHVNTLNTRQILPSKEWIGECCLFSLVEQYYLLREVESELKYFEKTYHGSSDVEHSQPMLVVKPNGQRTLYEANA